MKKEDDFDLVEIYAGTPFEAEMVRNLLIENGIDAFLKDAYIGMIAPWQSSAGGVGAVRVVVPGYASEKARIIIADYLLEMDIKQ